MSVKGVANAIRTAAVRLSADVSVRPLSTFLVAQDERIAASFTASNILAGIVPAPINAAIVVSPVQLAYDLGVWLTHLRFQESLGAMDQALLSFFKTRTENLQLAEDVSYQFYKNLNETIGLTDKQIFAVFKKLVDEASALDEYRMGLSKQIADRAGAQDAYARSFAKPRSDAAGVRDSKGFSLLRLLNDSGSVADSSNRQFVKGNQETLLFTEIRIKNFAKSIADVLKVTDDVDGAASILDDQEMQFIKQRSDVGFASDAFAFAMSYKRAYADLFGAQERIAVGFGKLLIDSGRAVDSKKLVVSKQLVESFGSRDLLAKVLGRPISDNARIAESKSIGFGSARTDSASFTDSGSVRSQGYCDFTYFAEDFVGASRTF